MLTTLQSIDEKLSSCQTQISLLNEKMDRMQETSRANFEMISTKMANMIYTVKNLDSNVKNPLGKVSRPDNFPEEICCKTIDELKSLDGLLSFDQEANTDYMVL